MNVCKADLFALLECFTWQKKLKTASTRKYSFKLTKLPLHARAKMKRVDFGVENPSTSDELSCHFMRQLFRQQVSLKMRKQVPHQLKMTSKDVAR